MMMTMQELARRWVLEHDEDAFAEYCQHESARLDAEESMSAQTNDVPPWLDLEISKVQNAFEAWATGRTNDANVSFALRDLRHAIAAALEAAYLRGRFDASDGEPHE